MYGTHLAAVELHSSAVPMVIVIRVDVWDDYVCKLLTNLMATLLLFSKLVPMGL